MQRSLRITLAMAIAAGAVVATAGTALASDDGPVNVNGTPLGDKGTHKVGPKVELPSLNKTPLKTPDLPSF